MTSYPGAIEPPSDLDCGARLPRQPATGPQVTFLDNNDTNNDGNNPSQCGERSVSPSVLMTPVVDVDVCSHE